jgi:hypothetical protein
MVFGSTSTCSACGTCIIACAGHCASLAGPGNTCLPWYSFLHRDFGRLSHPLMHAGIAGSCSSPC